jgi:hypothetical protein
MKDLIPKDQAKLRKEVQRVKEARKEGKWAIIRNKRILLGIKTKNIIINRNLGHFKSSLGIVVAFHGAKVLC